MSFFSEQSGLPTPSVDLPFPDLPTSNLRSTGQELAQGAKDVGFWDGIWSSLASWLVDFTALILGFVIRMTVPIAIFWAKTWAVAGRSMDPAIQEAAAIAVGDAFGVQVSGSSFQAIGQAGARAPVARNVAEAVLVALGGSFDASSGAGITPNSERAEAWLQSVTSLAIEGWLETWFFEMITLGQCETAGKLKDDLVQSLGIGRISNKVLAPVVDALVVQPFDWKVQKAYRPKLLGAVEAVRQFTRGRWTRAQLDDELGRQGYSQDRIEALINGHKLKLPDGDLSTLVNAGSMTIGEAQQYLVDLGYDTLTAARKLQVNEINLQRPIQRQLANIYVDAFVKGDIDNSELASFLQNSGLPPSEYTQLGTVAVARRQFAAPDLTLSQIASLVKDGLRTIGDYRDKALKLGYSLSDARDLELQLLLQMTEASNQKAATAAAKSAAAQAAAARTTAAQVKAAAEAAKLATKGVSVSKFEAMVRAGLRTSGEYRAFLIANGLTAANADGLTELLIEDMESARQLKLQRAALAEAAAEKHINLSQLQKAVVTGIISMPEFTSQLRQLSFTEDAIALLVEQATRDIADAKERVDVRAAAAAAAADKGVSISQFERAVRLGLRSVDDYAAFLSLEGYGADDVDLLADTLQSEVDADDAARELKLQAEANAAEKGLSLPDLERAVRAGVRTVDDYRAALVGLNYDSDAQDALLQLLQLKMDQDQQTLVLQGNASALLGQRGVSLVDIARGVELGLLQIETYTATLRAGGVSKDDADYLTLVEASKVAARKAQEEKAAAAAPLLAANGVSLSGLQSSVRAKRLTIDQYRTQLSIAGVDQSQITNLVNLISMELDAINAADAIRARDKATAGAKGLTLSQMEKAVREGVSGLQEYYALALELGYSNSDAQLLTATLSVQLDPGDEDA